MQSQQGTIQLKPRSVSGLATPISAPIRKCGRMTSRGSQRAHEPIDADAARPLEGRLVFEKVTPFFSEQPGGQPSTTRQASPSRRHDPPLRLCTSLALQVTGCSRPSRSSAHRSLTQMGEIGPDERI